MRHDDKTHHAVCVSKPFLLLAGCREGRKEEIEQSHANARGSGSGVEREGKHEPCRAWRACFDEA